MNPGSKKPGMLWLIVGIPAAAVLMGVVTVWIALSDPDPGVELDARPLSKTSYRDQR